MTARVRTEVINEEAFRVWVAAMRHPSLKQGTGRLVTLDRAGHEYYCCLGVATVACPTPMEMQSTVATGDYRGWVAYDGSIYLLPEKVREWLGLSDGNPVIGLTADIVEAGGLLGERVAARAVGDTVGEWVYLTTLNDVLRLTLPQIADVIEAKWLPDDAARRLAVAA